MSTPIKLGICGIGRIGHKHCQIFSQSDGRYQLVALCDQDSERVNAAQDEFGGRAYTDLAEFPADSEIELVILATRSLDHTRQAEQALAAGKIVLLEKPIAVTAADCLLLLHLLSSYPDKLFFGHNHRFEPAFANMQAIVAEGLLGDIKVVKINRHHPFMRRNDWQMRLDCGGGQLSVWGPHIIDQGLLFLDSPVRRVVSFLRRHLTPGDADDHVRIILEGENDRLVELEISYSAAIPAPYCTIYGDRGTLLCAQDQRELQLRYLPLEFRWAPASAEAGTPELGRGLGADPQLPWVNETRKVTPETNMWEVVETALAQHLYESIRQQRPFPIRSTEALEVLRITEIVKQQNPHFNWIG